MGRPALKGAIHRVKLADETMEHLAQLAEALAANGEDVQWGGDLNVSLLVRRAAEIAAVNANEVTRLLDAESNLKTLLGAANVMQQFGLLPAKPSHPNRHVAEALRTFQGVREHYAPPKEE